MSYAEFRQTVKLRTPVVEKDPLKKVVSSREGVVSVDRCADDCDGARFVA